MARGGWRRNAAGQGDDPSGTLVVEAWDNGAVEFIGMCPVKTAFVFWMPSRTRHLLEAADAAGLIKHRSIYMRKPDPKPMPGGRTRWSVEPIWVLSRDGFVMYGGDDMFEASTPRFGRDASATEHPYEKPLMVMTWLLSKARGFSRAIDPFMGSGTTLVAAHQLGMRAIGVEIEERYCEIAAKRLSQSVLPLDMSAAGL